MAKKISDNGKKLFDSQGSAPVMMEEFYAGDQPNPNLRQFVEEHATPYDPSTDEYDVAAFNLPITSTKSTAIYNMHTYPSKKPHEAIRRYIRHHTKPGDLVLDPFSGSGGTAIAALLEGRAAIALDLSPSASYITAQSLRVFSCRDFHDALTQLCKKVEKEILSRFTWSQPGIVKAVIYTETFRCVKCLMPVPFISASAGQSREFRGRTKSKEHCPNCAEPLKTSGDRLGFVPAELHLAANIGSKSVRKVDVLSDKSASKQFPVSPSNAPKRLRTPLEGYIQPRLSKNLAKAGATTAADLFSEKNLACLLEIEGAIDELKNVSDAARSLLHLAVHAILYNCTRMYRYRTQTAGGGGFSGTYYIPHLSKCINPWSSFLDKCRDIEKAIDEAQAIEHRRIIANVSVESSTSFCKTGHIPPNSIDYIFTDPPYGGTYHYGALNFLWEAWRGCDLSWRTSEITISEDGALTYADWHDRMLASMKQCFDVLKPGRWMTLCFHGEVDLWEAINDITSEVGFVVAQAEQAVFIDTDQKSYNQLTGETAKKRDLVLSYRKPKPGDWMITQVFIPADVDVPTFNDLAIQIIKEFLASHPGSSKDRIYDVVISRMVRKGQMEAHDFDALLRSVAEEVQQAKKENLFQNKEPNLWGSHVYSRWYLKETADQFDQAEQAKEDVAAARLSKYIHDYLKKKPELEGVHYSDLFEQYLSIQDKPRRVPIEWLPEFFIRTGGGTWRLPGEEERLQLANLREAGTLRRIKRFANVLIEGVPVREKDRPSSDVDLLAWLRQCRRAGLYEQGKAIYEKGGLNSANLTDEQQIEAEDDYRICARRGSSEEAKPKRERRKKLEDDE